MTFARPDALQGTLGETLKEVRPTIFFAVPRVWEKFEERIKEFGAQSSGFARALAKWAKDKAKRANLSQVTIFREGEERYSSPWSYPIA